MENAIERRMHELRQIAKEYAEAKSQQAYLEHFRKAKLSILMKKYEGHGVNSVTAQERDAHADPEYQEFLEGLREATRIAEKLFWELQIARMGAELWRTQQANMRVERKGYGA